MVLRATLGKTSKRSNLSFDHRVFPSPKIGSCTIDFGGGGEGVFFCGQATGPAKDKAPPPASPICWETQMGEGADHAIRPWVRFSRCERSDIKHDVRAHQGWSSRRLGSSLIVIASESEAISHIAG